MNMVVNKQKKIIKSCNLTVHPQNDENKDSYRFVNC